MGHHYRFAVKRSSKLLSQPVLGDVVPGNQVFRSKSPVVGVTPNVLKVVHALPSGIASRDPVPC